jgi:hypothetical protein
LLIISALISPIYSKSQTDTSKLKKELTALLKKYGLKDASFLLKVESLNQKGGQTAFEINNYNAKEIHVVNGPNYGINGNVSNEKQLTEEDKNQLISFIEKTKRDSASKTMNFMVMISQTSNGAKVAFQISEYLKSRGYKLVGNGTLIGESFSGVQITVRRRFQSDVEKTIEINVGVL